MPSLIFDYLTQGIVYRVDLSLLGYRLTHPMILNLAYLRNLKLRNLKNNPK